MKLGNYKFVIYLLAATLVTIVVAVFIEIYKSKFAIADFGNITSIIQGTFGVAVSLAGAFVAIRLAQLSTMIIEKEKKREDSKFYHQIINEAIIPIKGLTNNLQQFYFAIHPFRALLYASKNQIENIEPKLLEDELKQLKLVVVSNLKYIIEGFKGITENQYSYALWLYITDKRLKDNKLLLSGGGARSAQHGEELWGNSQGGNEYLIEDLNVLHSTLQIVLDRFSGCELTVNDLETAKEIYHKAFRKFDEISVVNSSEFMVILTLISLYYTRFLATQRFDSEEYFENKLVLLFIDIYYNIPQKDDLIGFSKSLFSPDDTEIIRDSPIAKTFELLNDAYWFSFLMTYDIKRLKISDLKARKHGEILSNPDCAKAWNKWQMNKVGLYKEYTNQWNRDSY